MRIRTVSSRIYTKQYYLNDCFGAETFKKTSGKELPEKIQKFIANIHIKKGMRILDVGCGRGDLAFYLARHGASVVGIDYAQAAIAIAEHARRMQSKSIQKLVSFQRMNAKKLNFPSDNFDVVISIDVFEHLYQEELVIAMQEIKRVLKPKGILLVHTEPNKIYLEWTHKYYSYPMSRLLVKVNRLFTGKEYFDLPKDLRNDLHKKQHVNEPTYNYLKHLFVQSRFEGKIISHLGLLKPLLSWKDKLYNSIVLIYPLCRLRFMRYFFATEYICIMRNKK